MKYLSSLLLGFILVCFAACGGSSSYNPEKCKELKEKIESGAELTQKDYSELIDQLGAVTIELNTKENEIGDDKEKKAEYLESQGKDIAGYALGFGFYVYQHTKDLDADNMKKLTELEKKLNELKEQR